MIFHVSLRQGIQRCLNTDLCAGGNVSGFPWTQQDRTKLLYQEQGANQHQGARDVLRSKNTAVVWHRNLGEPNPALHPTHSLVSNTDGSLRACFGPGVCVATFEPLC